MIKIFAYECRRLLWNKFFFGLLAVTFFYGWQVLNGTTILGVSRTAPFSPWSFGDYLSRMLPLLWIGAFLPDLFHLGQGAPYRRADRRRTRRAAAVCAGSWRRGACRDQPARTGQPYGSILLLRLVFSLVCVGQPAAAGGRRTDPAAGLCGRQRLGAGAAEAVVGLRLDAAFRSLRGRSAAAGFKPLERALFHRGAFGIGDAGSGLLSAGGGSFGPVCAAACRGRLPRAAGWKAAPAYAVSAFSAAGSL